MAKKRRSAKQKANDKRLGRMAKARSKKRKTTTRKRRTTKTGMVRKTARRAYKGIKKRVKRKSKTNKDSMWSNW